MHIAQKQFTKQIVTKYILYSSSKRNNSRLFE